MGTSPDDGSSLRAWLADPRGEFQRWRHPRPVGGSLLLILGGVLIGYVPVQFAAELLLIGGGFTILGLVFAVLVVFCGIAVLSKPQYSSLFGVLGIALSTLSIFGALGGLFIGMLVGTTGGILCYSWEPPDGYQETTLVEASEFIWQETGGFIWQDSGGFIWNRDADTTPETVDSATDSTEEFGFTDDAETDGATVATGTGTAGELEGADDESFEFPDESAAADQGEETADEPDEETDTDEDEEDDLFDIDDDSEDEAFEVDDDIDDRFKL